MNALPPPGWHPDPNGAPLWRWWDGSQWTEHTHTGQATQADGGGAPTGAAPKGPLWQAEQLALVITQPKRVWHHEHAVELRTPGDQPLARIANGEIAIDAAGSPVLVVTHEHQARRTPVLLVSTPDGRSWGKVTVRRYTLAPRIRKVSLALVSNEVDAQLNSDLRGRELTLEHGDDKPARIIEVDAEGPARRYDVQISRGTPVELRALLYAALLRYPRLLDTLPREQRRPN